MNEKIEKYIKERETVLASKRKKEKDILLKELKLDVKDISDEEYEQLLKYSKDINSINRNAEKNLNIASQVIFYAGFIIGIIFLMVGCIDCDFEFDSFNISYLLEGIISFLFGYITYAAMQVLRNISLKLEKE